MAVTLRHVSDKNNNNDYKCLKGLIFTLCQEFYTVEQSETILGTASKIVIKSTNLLYTVIYNWMKYKTPFKLLAHLS